MKTTYVLRDHEPTATVCFDSPGGHFDHDFRVISPPDVERSTGTLRHPDAAIDLPAALISLLRGAAEKPAPDGPVVGVLVHLFSRKAVAVGVFDTGHAATGWWDRPFNRFTHDADVRFLIASPAELLAADEAEAEVTS